MNYLTISLLSIIGRAQAAGPDLRRLGEVHLPGSKFGATGLEGVLGAAISWLLILAGGLVVIAIMYSGIMYITSGGDQTKAENAKKNLLWAIIGLIVILMFYLVIGWVGTALGTHDTP